MTAAAEILALLADGLEHPHRDEDDIADIAAGLRAFASALDDQLSGGLVDAVAAVTCGHVEDDGEPPWRRVSGRPCCAAPGSGLVHPSCAVAAVLDVLGVAP